MTPSLTFSGFYSKMGLGDEAVNPAPASLLDHLSDEEKDDSD